MAALEEQAGFSLRSRKRTGEKTSAKATAKDQGKSATLRLQTSEGERSYVGLVAKSM